MSRCRASTGTDLTKKPPNNNNNNKRGVEKEDKKRDQQVRSIASTHQHAINIATEKSMTHGARVRGGPELKQLVSEGVKPKSSLPSTEPPWHEPTSPQLRTCWTARLMSMPLAFRAILTRSPSAEMAPCAQHEPQSKVGGDAGFGSGKQFIPRGEWGKKGGKITRNGEKFEYRTLRDVLVARHGAVVDTRLVAPAGGVREEGEAVQRTIAQNK